MINECGVKPIDVNDDGVAGSGMSTAKRFGYGGSEYAFSLAEYGTPQFLPNSRGWLLRRAIPDSPYQDAMGCYPVFACDDWCLLAEDIDSQVGELVSVSIVVDPLGSHSPELLAKVFPDMSRPFKDHFLIDLSLDWRKDIADHHRRNIRSAHRNVVVERVSIPLDVLPDWVRLYQHLVERHGIKGMTTFSLHHFEGLLRNLDIRVYRAIAAGRTVGMLLWMLQSDAAYYHLGAYDDEGYSAKASYALFDVSLNELCAEGFRWVNLGGAAGIGGGSSGLSRFKEGWSNLRKPVYFCGRILNGKAYDSLVARLDLQPTTYFPAYRAGEFV